MIYEFAIGNKLIGRTQPTFVIAEAGINHNGNLDQAIQLVREAKRSGADAVKFQTYLTSKRVPENSPIFNILKQCELSGNDFSEIKKVADEESILFFSTPFDQESVDILENLDVPLYKIASFDITNLPLVEAVANTEKPTIISRGMANGPEIDAAVQLFRDSGTPFVLLHCISAYPTEPKDANLNVIHTLWDKYDCTVGFSDHTIGTHVPVFAVAAGARVIEKHFTLDKEMDGPDHKLSADPSDLAKMIREIRALEVTLGAYDLKTYDSEKGTLVVRRGNQKVPS